MQLLQRVLLAAFVLVGCQPPSLGSGEGEGEGVPIDTGPYLECVDGPATFSAPIPIQPERSYLPLVRAFTRRESYGQLTVVTQQESCELVVVDAAGVATTAHLDRRCYDAVSWPERSAFLVTVFVANDSVNTLVVVDLDGSITDTNVPLEFVSSVTTYANGFHALYTDGGFGAVPRLVHATFANDLSVVVAQTPFPGEERVALIGFGPGGGLVGLNDGATRRLQRLDPAAALLGPAFPSGAPDDPFPIGAIAVTNGTVAVIASRVTDLGVGEEQFLALIHNDDTVTVSEPIVDPAPLQFSALEEARLQPNDTGYTLTAFRSSTNGARALVKASWDVEGVLAGSSMTDLATIPPPDPVLPCGGTLQFCPTLSFDPDNNIVVTSQELTDEGIAVRVAGPEGNGGAVVAVVTRAPFGIFAPAILAGPSASLLTWREQAGSGSEVFFFARFVNEAGELLGDAISLPPSGGLATADAFWFVESSGASFTAHILDTAGTLRTVSVAAPLGELAPFGSGVIVRTNSELLIIDNDGTVQSRTPVPDPPPDYRQLYASVLAVPGASAALLVSAWYSDTGPYLTELRTIWNDGVLSDAVPFVAPQLNSRGGWACGGGCLAFLHAVEDDDFNDVGMMLTQIEYDGTRVAVSQWSVDDLRLSRRDATGSECRAVALSQEDAAAFDVDTLQISGTQPLARLALNEFSSCESSLVPLRQSDSYFLIESCADAFGENAIAQFRRYGP